MKRRHALALLGSGLLARPALAQSQNQGRTVVDSAKRSVTLPAKVEKVFVAGPPASVLAYVLAPDAMVGWIRQPSPAEKEFLAAPARDLPETGRLTGRGDTVSLERLVAVALADKAQGGSRPVAVQVVHTEKFVVHAAGKLFRAFGVAGIDCFDHAVNRKLLHLRDFVRGQYPLRHRFSSGSGNQILRVSRKSYDRSKPPDPTRAP